MKWFKKTFSTWEKTIVMVASIVTIYKYRSDILALVAMVKKAIVDMWKTVEAEIEKEKVSMKDESDD